MIGRVLCFLGLHEWWPTQGFSYVTERTPAYICGRCPAKKYGGKR